MGSAEPPDIAVRSFEKSRFGRSGSMPIQMVGTPAAQVTPSCSISFASDAGAHELGETINIARLEVEELLDL